jgi:hypothetical protein
MIMFITCIILSRLRTYHLVCISLDIKTALSKREKNLVIDHRLNRVI